MRQLRTGVAVLIIAASFIPARVFAQASVNPDISVIPRFVVTSDATEGM